jgi:hypothetical protein
MFYEIPSFKPAGQITAIASMPTCMCAISSDDSREFGCYFSGESKCSGEECKNKVGKGENDGGGMEKGWGGDR